MTAPAKARVAVALGGLALLLMAANVLLVWSIDATASAGSPPAASLWLLGLAGAPIVGMVIASRRPDNTYGWLILSFGLTAALLEVTELFALYALEVYGSAGVIGLTAAVLSQSLWGATMGHLPLLLLLFPDGELPSARWAWLRAAVVGFTVVGSVLALFMPGLLGSVPVDNPIGLDGVTGTVITIVVNACVVAIFVSLLPAAASLFVRRRHATTQERLQLRWFSWAAAVLATSMIASAFGVAGEIVTNFILMLALGGLFAAIGIAVLRYRLYDIDRVVSRTVTYALVTAVLLSMYLLAVSVLTTISAPVTGESPLAVAVATLGAAAAFGPVRRGIQAAVDQRFNRARYDAEQTVAAFRGRLRDQLDLDDIGADLVSTTQSAVQPARAALWLHPTSGASR